MLDGTNSVSNEPSSLENSIQIGFGGGCHWCTEAVFAALHGVYQVQQGHISSTAPNDTYSEAVLLDYDEQQIDLKTLIAVHLRTHASSSQHSMRSKYRSAIYVEDDDLAIRCNRLVTELQNEFENPLITQVLKMVDFRLSPTRYRNYYLSNPDKPFCKVYIEPKLEMMKRDFGSAIKTT